VTRNLVIGSGPAAAGVSLALSQQPRQQVTLLDLGGALEPAHRAALDRLAGQEPGQWDVDDIDLINAQPVSRVRGELPQKRSHGSDYPFRELGQLTGVTAAPGANSFVVSSAYGGFSNVWGAQVMPFSRATFDRWPISWNEFEPHYKAVLQEVPLAAEQDDLDDLFPVLGPARALPTLAPRTTEVLRRYELHRGRLRRQGVMVGRARLALRAAGCVRCGLCMTGCPYSLIYSAAHTFDKLRRKGLVTYHGGLLVFEIGQRGDEVFAHGRDLTTGQVHRFSADRLFVACGGLGTTRLVLGSLPAPPPAVELAESIQYVMPFLSARPVTDPRERAGQDWTLNQFNMLVDFGDEGYDTSMIHFYPYNPAFLAALPAPLRSPALAALTSQLLRRISVGLGYLPSWRSPRVRVTHRRVSGNDLPALSIDASSAERPPLYRALVRRLLRVAPMLDLWPALPAARLSGAAKSYHFGGSFPHSRPGHEPAAGMTTDRLGRLPMWDRIHLVDGSVFPSVPSTTFTLTVMANAHRIASETLIGMGGHGG
jgi:choline dehydrogenase-like flavoprotein